MSAELRCPVRYSAPDRGSRCGPSKHDPRRPGQSTLTSPTGTCTQNHCHRPSILLPGSSYVGSHLPWLAPCVSAPPAVRLGRTHDQRNYNKGASGITVKDYSPQRRRVHTGYFLLPFLRNLSIRRHAQDRLSAVQIPSPRTEEIALARLATQKPEYPK